MQTAYKSVRLFKSAWLEWFSHIHPLTPLVVWGPVAVYFIWRGLSVHQLGALSVLGIGALALLVWSLTEYLLHRFVFHFEARRPWKHLQEKLLFIMHGIHHADPVDPTRLVMAPVVSLGIAFVVYFSWRAVLGPAWVDPFFGFFLIGYLWYDYTHYAVHHFPMSSRIGKALKQSHMIHHYVNHGVRWGVSSPLWDWVFGTLSERAPVSKKTASAAGLKRASGTAHPAKTDLHRA